MTKTQQIKLVREISRNIANELVSHIKNDRVPDHWDGHELRLLLAEKHASSGRMSSLAGHGTSTRARDYRNTVLVNNL